jgi:hypothetical protein
MTNGRRRNTVRQTSFILALVTLCVVAFPATPAALTWYTNRAAWEAAVGDTFNLIDFNEVSAGSYSTSAGATIEGVWFQAYNEAGNWYLYINNDDPLNQKVYAAGNSQSYPPAAYTRAKFLNSATYKAAGVNVSTSSSYFYVKEDAVGNWVQTNTTGFVGFVSDTPVGQVWFASRTGVYGSPGFYFLDNFVFSNGPAQQPGETPDLDTLILCGTGLSIFSFVMRKRAKA